jgi:hypothetical protein
MALQRLLIAAILAAGGAAYAQDGQAPQQNFPGLMNPAISVNGLFLAGVQANDGVAVPHAPPEGEPDPNALPGQGQTFGTGLSVQEIEVQFLAAVDPYFKANVVLSVPGAEGLEVEEGYVSLVSVPRLTINVGKLKEPFGRENQTHTHALLTIDKSLVGTRIFGEEGLNDMAVDAALLLPTPWYSEVTLGVDAGGNDLIYGSGDPLGLGSFGHLKNLFDFGNTSLELGVSGLHGEDRWGGPSNGGAVDLTLKSHGASRHQFNRLTWQSEAMIVDQAEAPVLRQQSGLYSTLEYSFSKRFWLGGRYDLAGLTQFEDPAQGATLIGVLVPTEFSAFRLQAQRQFLPGGHTIDSVVGQLDFTLGTHPAHSY